MEEINKISKDMWEPIDHDKKKQEEISRPSLTYWQDAWRRLKQNKLSMIGLVVVIIIVLFALLGPVFSRYSYYDQDLDFTGIPPRFPIYKINNNKFIFVHNEFRIYEVTEKGELVSKINPIETNVKEKYKLYDIDGNEIKLDYSLAMKNKNKDEEIERIDTERFKVLVNEQEVEVYKKVFNKTYWFGTDTLGRDVYVRVLYGARISLLVAVVATLVNFFIGVLYGGIAGYFGGRTDNIMMRIVDILNSIPLLLIVILLMVIIGPGLKTIIITFGAVYWVGMARIVRGQVLSLKEQEFVLAARTLGANTRRIMIKHLLPNALGPIIVAMTMMIPSAIFTESFLSFIGLGVSAPQASWGTLASDALGGIRSYPYQLFFPSIAICLTMLGFNFLGDGLRNALDPRLRK